MASRSNKTDSKRGVLEHRQCDRASRVELDEVAERRRKHGRVGPTLPADDVARQSTHFRRVAVLPVPAGDHDRRERLRHGDASTRRLKCLSGTAELSMGPFCVTQSNPIHQLIDPTQPNPLQVEKFGPNPTEPNTTNNRASYSLVVTYFYAQNLSVSGTGQISPKIKFNCLVKPNLI